MTERRRLHVVPDTDDLARPNACAALRLLDPLSHPAVAARFDVTVGTGLPRHPIDVLVLQRMSSGLGPDAVEAMLLSAGLEGVRILYDLDDNLLDPHPDPGSDRFIAPHRRSVRLLLRRADQVTVSTPALADRVRRLARSVRVLPNALDERRLPPARPRPPRDRLSIGYFGTFTHLRDLMSVAGPLRAALAALPTRPVLQFCGITEDTRALSLFEGVADVRTIPATGDYDSFVALLRDRIDWDIGLAPLAEGAFERTKSDIKFLEYGGFGIAGLYSAHPAYDAVRHGETGIVAAPDSWAAGLAMLTDPGVRARIAANARAYVDAERTLGRMVGHWLGALEAAMAPR